MALPRHTGRSRFTLFVLVLTSITLLSLDARDFGPVEGLKNGTATVLSPFRSIGDTVFSPVGDAWSSVTSRGDLEAENERLRIRLDELLATRVANASAAEELAELREMLELRGILGHDTVAAEVTAGSVSNFDPYVLEIDKGTGDGVQDGMPVIVDGGMVGRVEDALRGSARVRLITDPDVNIGVLVVGTDEIGIVAGTGEDAPLRVTDSIPVGADVEVGDILVTSGLDRSPYPEGLTIGLVTAVEIDEAGLEKELVVEPTARLDRLDFVTVVLYDPDAEQVDPDDATVAGDG